MSGKLGRAASQVEICFLLVAQHAERTCAGHEEFCHGGHKEHAQLGIPKSDEMTAWSESLEIDGG
eukprot:3005295-Karenia_brevis.AAC.1